MSRHPLHMMDSDTDPSEAAYDSDVVSVHLDQPVIHPIEISDDSSTDAQISPPMSPVTTPISPPTGIATTTPAHYSLGETSHRPILRRTPRMCVRDFPLGPLAPRDKAPQTEADMPLEEPLHKRPRHTHFDWMPRTLREWRSLEGFPPTFEHGESSHAAATPFTREPLELTVPTLVAVAHTLFGLHYGTQAYIRELMSDTSRLEGDVSSMYARLDTTEIHVDVDRESADATRARVTTLERRTGIAILAAGAYALMTTIGMLAGMYLFYSR